VYATIPIQWKESNKTLTIGKRTGEFPCMLKERTFHIVWVAVHHCKETVIPVESAGGIKYELEVRAFARRRGREWYIGVLNGGAAATLQIVLSFLCRGKWQASVFGDDPANPATFNRESKAVKADDKLTVSMSQRGGAVVWITKSAQ
jgi:hypothetical protein